MGNTSKKLAAKCTLLTKDEQKHVAATFRAASKNSDKIREDDLIVSRKVDAESLEKFWGPLIDPRLAQFLSNFLFGTGADKQPSVDFNRFAELYVYNVRGTLDERMQVLYNCLGSECNETTEIPHQLLREYCEGVASTFMKTVKSSTEEPARLWLEKGFRGRASHIQALGEALAATIDDCDPPQGNYTYAQLSKWMHVNVLLRQMSELVFVSLYGIEQKPAPPLPIADGIESMPDYPAFTDLSHVVWMNSNLPPALQNRWRFLFSTHIHGESFSTMVGRILDHGPSLLIIQDTNGHIFGGYAPSSWSPSPNFTGDDTSFLFTLAPKMRMYPATGYNNHYQYMNYHQKTMPNGLMMGGQLEFAGIWVDADPFGAGSSAESCSTYSGFRRLSKDQDFRIKSVEVWGVGDKPLTEKESDERDLSILDKSPEAKAILDMAGRTRHSEGIREPPPL